MSNPMRARRIADEIKRQLALIIQSGFHDLPLPPFTSITQVRMTGDLGRAFCYVSVLGSAEAVTASVEILEEAKPFLRSRLAQMTRLRKFPALTFVADTSIAEGVRITKLIDEVSRADRAAEAHRQTVEFREENDT
ncbi:MAG: 30S ribosome-binding factor RbfA [Clostridiaceae bacterium]|nr:30S ribosome-binding factor RbfA [Clostridiaceae bacterium]